MDSLQKLFDKRLDKIQECNNFFDLAPEKMENLEQLHQLKGKIDEQKIIVKKCQKDVLEFKEKSVAKYNNLMKESQKIQLMMLHILSEMDKEDAAKSNGIRKQDVARSNQKSNIKIKTEKIDDMQLSNQLKTPIMEEVSGGAFTTPRLTLTDYKNSPFARRTRPVSLQFTDFEATIKPEVFQQIPPYMKGRDNLNDLQNFLDTVIIQCFNEKYQLALKERHFVRNFQDLEQWKLYRSQENYFPGKKFITEGDISILLGRVIDKKMGNRIKMLRHIQILKELRYKTATCFIWCLKN